ncbi:MAG: hypothetical protein FWE09_04925 [Treponema sp.]|nr:hypothetical protein [Treponema sp.]
MYRSDNAGAGAGTSVWTTIDNASAASPNSRFPAGHSISSIAYGNNQWIAGGQDGRMTRSSDGTNWHEIGPLNTEAGLSDNPDAGKPNALNGEIRVVFGRTRTVQSGIDLTAANSVQNFVALAQGFHFRFGYYSAR